MVDKHKVSLLKQQLQVQLHQRGDAWRIDNVRLLGFPNILPDEVFSSWIWRALASGRITKEQLVKVWKIKQPLHWIDGNSALLNFERISKTLNTTPTNILESTVWPIQANLSIPRPYA